MLITCPVCSLECQDHELSIHLIEYHYSFIVVLRSLYMADIPFMDEFDDYSYEDLSDLCDRMGTVALGADIDAETTVVITDSSERCPICLEQHTENIRKIISCGHKYCSPCIETWLSSHKTCPICKIELVPATASTEATEAEATISGPQ